MALLHFFDVFHISKVKLVDFVGNIQSVDNSIHGQADIDVLVGVAANVEVSRNLLHREGSLKSASVLVLECCFGHIVLFLLIGLPQKFKVSGVDPVSIGIEPIFLD